MIVFNLGVNGCVLSLLVEEVEVVFGAGVSNCLLVAAEEHLLKGANLVVEFLFGDLV